MFSRLGHFLKAAFRLAAALSLATSATIVSAQAYPNRPIRLIVPYSAGGSADALVRPLAARLSARLGQAVIVDSKPGANGILGMDHVAHAAADGYTLVVGAIGPLAVTPALQKLPFDPVKDFAPVTFLAAVPNVLVVNSSASIKSVADLVALAKSKPGELNYGSAGVASSNQLASELFNLAAGIKTVHVPYKGGAPAEMDLLAGHLTFIFDNLPSSIPHLQSGGFRPLAVTSLKRQPSLPAVPTMVELGYKDFEAASWFGVLAPSGTPPAVIDRLNKALLEVMAEPATRDALIRQGFDLNPGTPEQFAAFIQTESGKWQAVVKAAGIVGP